MVCMQVAFHENDGNQENDDNDEDNSDSHKQGVECWIRGNHGNRSNDENPKGLRGASQRFPKQLFRNIRKEPTLASQILRVKCSASFRRSGYIRCHVTVCHACCAPHKSEVQSCKHPSAPWSVAGSAGLSETCLSIPTHLLIGHFHNENRISAKPNSMP